MGEQRQLVIDGLFNFKDTFRSEKTRDYIKSCLDHLIENNITSMDDLSKLKYGLGFHEDPDSSDVDDDDDDFDEDDPCAPSSLVSFAYACDGSGPHMFELKLLYTISRTPFELSSSQCCKLKCSGRCCRS